MNSDSERTFASPSEEIQFWKQQCEEKENAFNQLEEELSDYQLTSREVEGELEKEIENLEKRNRELTSTVSKMKQDLEDAMEKSIKQSQESAHMIQQLQDENHDLKQRKTKLNKDKVMLEQENEDLQRRERELSATVADLQDKLNKLIEDSAMYQIEFDEEQESNKELIQRLRDENRDLEQELVVLKKSTSPASPRKSVQSPRLSEPAKPHRTEHLCDKCGRKSSPIRLVKLQKVDPETLRTIGLSSPSSPLAQSPQGEVKSKRGNSSPIEKPKEQQQVEKPTTKTEPPQTPPPNRARSTTVGASTPRNIASTPRPVLTPRLQVLSTPRKQPSSYLTPVSKQQASTRSRSSSVPQKKNIDL